MPDPKNDFLNRLVNTKKGVNEGVKNRWKNVYKEQTQEELDIDNELAEKSRQRIEEAAFEADRLAKKQEESIRVEEAKQAQIQRDEEIAVEKAKLIEDSKPKDAFEVSVMKENGLDDLFVYNTIKKEIEEFESIGANSKNRKIDAENKKLDYFDNPGKALKNEFENFNHSIMALFTPEGNDTGWIGNKTKEQKEKYKENLEKLAKYEKVPISIINENEKTFKTSVITPQIKKLQDELTALGSFGKIPNPTGSIESMFKSEEENNTEKQEYIKKVNRAKEIKEELANLKSADNIADKTINNLTNHLDKNEGKGHQVYVGMLGSEGYSALGNSGLGFNQLHTEITLIKAKAKNDREEPLTNSESILLKTGGVENQTEKLRLNEGKTFVKLGETVRGSGEFVLGLATPQAITAPLKAVAFQFIKTSFAKKMAQNLVKEGVEQVGKEVLEESVEAGIKGAIKGGVDNSLSKIATNVSENLAGKGANALPATKELFEKGVKEGIKKNVDNAGEQLVKKGTVQSTKEAIKALPEKALNLGVDLADAAVQPLFMNHTYNMYNQKMNDAIVLTKNTDGEEIILTTKKQKEKYQSEFNKTKLIEQEKLSRLEKDPIGNEKEIKKIKEHLFDLQGDLDKIYDPETGKIPEDMKWYDAAFHAYSETAKEVLSEMFVGKFADKSFKMIDRKFLGNGIANTKAKIDNFVFKKADKVSDNILGKGAGFISRISAKNSQFDDIFQSMPGEMAEEIVVQATPTYNAEKGGYFMSDYMKQLEELRNPEFYALTAMSTGLMGGTMNTFNLANGIKKYTTGGDEYRQNVNENYKKDKLDEKVAAVKYEQSKKRLKELYNGLDKNVTDEKLATLISMNTGRLGFDGLSYDAAVAEQRLAGNDIVAKNVEAKAFNTMFLHAVNSDTVDEFEKVMKKMVTSKDVHPDKRENALHMLKYTIPANKQIDEKYKDNVNLFDIKQINNTINLFKMHTKGIEDVLPVIEERLKEKIKTNIKAENLPEGFVIADFSDLNKKEYTEEQKGNIMKFQEDNAYDLGMLSFNKKNYVDAQKEILETQKEFEYQTNPDNQVKIKTFLLKQQYSKLTKASSAELNAYKKAFNDLGIKDYDAEIDKNLGKTIVQEAIKAEDAAFISPEEQLKQQTDEVREGIAKDIKEDTPEQTKKKNDFIAKENELNTTPSTPATKTTTTSSKVRKVNAEDIESSENNEVFTDKDPIVTSDVKPIITPEAKGVPTDVVAKTEPISSETTETKVVPPVVRARPFMDFYDIAEAMYEQVKTNNVNFTEEQKKEAIDKIEGFEQAVKQELGIKENDKIDFKDIIQYLGTNYDENQAETSIKDLFSAIVVTYKIAGKEISNANAIYNELYNQTEIIVNDFLKFAKITSEQIANSNSKTTEQVIEDNSNILKEVVEAKKTPLELEQEEKRIEQERQEYEESLENNSDELANSLQEEIEDTRTTSSDPKAGFLGVPYKTETVNGVSVKKHAGLTLNQNTKTINVKYILNPSYMKTGTILEVKVPKYEDVKDDKVSSVVIKNNIEVIETATFEEWCKARGINTENIESNTPDNQKLYYDKIPLIATKDGNNIFYIQDTDWYNKSNIGGVANAQENTIREGKAKTSELRRGIRLGNGKIKISNRKFGSLFNQNKQLKQKDAAGNEMPIPPVPISEATKDSKLIIAKNGTEFFGMPDNKWEDFDNKTPLSEGFLYDVRETTEGKFIALHVQTNDTTKGEDINDIAYNNVKHAVIAAIVIALNKDQKVNPKKPRTPKEIEESLEVAKKLSKEITNLYGMTLEKALEIQKAILNNHEIDITVAEGNKKTGLEGYLSMFVGTSFNSEFLGQLNGNIRNEKEVDKYPSKVNYISFNHGALSIVLKTNGIDIDSFVNFNGISSGAIPSTAILKFLATNFKDAEGSFRKTRFMASASQLPKNERFVQISDTGVPTVKDGYSYQDYLKDTVKTNIRSFTIADVTDKGKDTGKERSISDIQSMVYIELLEPIAETTTDNVAKDNVQPVSPGEKINGKVKTYSEDLEYINNESKETPEVNKKDIKDEVEQEEVKEEPKQETEDTFIDRLNKALSHLLGDPELVKDLKSNGILIDMIQNFNNENLLLFESPLNLSAQQETELVNMNSRKVSVLTPIEQSALVNSLFNLISNSLSEASKKKNLSKEQISQEIFDSVDKYLQPQIDALNSLLSRIEKATNNFTENEANGTKGKEVMYLSNALSSAVDKLNQVIEEKQIIRNNNSPLVTKFAKFFSEVIDTENIENVKEAEAIDTNPENGVDKNYSKSSLEVSVKTSFTQNLRLLFTGIKKKYKDGTDVINFAGLNEYVNADQVISMLLDITVNNDYNLSELLEFLKNKNHDQTYMQIHDAIAGASKQIQKELMYKTAVRRLDMHMLMSTRDAFGNIRNLYKNLSNSNSEMLENKWASKFERSDMFEIVDKKYVYQKESIKKVLKAIQDFKNNENKTPEGLQKVLEMFGISLDINAAKDVLTTLSPAQGKGGILMLFQKHLTEILEAFNDPKGASLLDGKMVDNKVKIVFIRSSNTNPFKFVKAALKKIIEKEVHYTGERVSKSIRSGDKTVQGVIQNNMMYQTLQNLKKNDSQYFKDLKAIPYSKNNFLLKMLDADKELRKNLKLAFVPLNVMKTNITLTELQEDGSEVITGKKEELSGDVNEVSSSDFTLSQISSFHNKIKDIETSGGGGFSFRVSNMYSHAIADKGQILQLATAVVNLSPVNFDIAENNKVAVNDNLLEFLLQQLYDSEFDRILSIHQNKMNDIEGTNIKNYDNASAYFLGLPIFNEINLDGIPIHEILRQSFNTNVEGGYLFNNKEKFRNAAKELLAEFLDAKLKEKVDENDTNSEWRRFGFLTHSTMKSELEEKQDEDKRQLDKKVFLDTKPSIEDRVKFDNDQKLERETYNKNKKDNSLYKINNRFDTNYVNGFNPTDYNSLQVAKMLALDFVVNDLLNKSNIHQLFAGDLALYSKGEKKFISRGENGQVIFDHIGFAQAIGENLNKRFSMEIAPGYTPVDSKNDSYFQVMVQDVISITSTAKNLITQYYGSVSEANATLLNNLQTVDDQIELLYGFPMDKTQEEIEEQLEELFVQKEKISKSLREANKEIAGFFEIEGTDAQEYTTWREHIDILLRKGDISEEVEAILKSAYNKLNNGEEVNKEELAVIMNPLKPMYGGHHTTKDIYGKPIVNRVIYIKSSSIPLLPQLTTDIKLNKVRLILEQLERVGEKNVRMSFQTAVKIGSIDTKLTMNDLYNTSFEDLYKDGKGLLAKSTLELKREGFRIQQDNPYKTAKNLKAGKEDHITRASQMWKSLMSGGIANNDNRIFPNIFDKELISKINKTLSEQGKDLIQKPAKGDKNKSKFMLTGRELNTIKFEVEKMYHDLRLKDFYKSLGLKFNNKTNKHEPTDRNKTIIKLHKLLEKEAIKFPDDVVDGLRLVDLVGQTDFTIPLWISSNSGKFETILQSFIYKKTMETTLPGYSHILASSEGFEKTKTQVQSAEELTKEQSKGIVWLDGKREGNLLATRTNLVTGELEFSEILIQSKFRKTVIDENNIEKTVLIDLTQEPYSKRDENGVLVLNRDMIDKELLSNFSYRIPTSGHQSGAMLQVVGFLPEAMGDVIVVPKEHTKQIGEDFDVDKRNVYKLNYIYNKEDKTIKVLKYSPNETNYEQKIKMLENAMINTYSSVFSSPDNDIQKMINKILSMENADNATKMIDKRINENKQKDRFFTIYSDTYQRNLLRAAIDGALGTGVHSNAVTFQAQLERLEKKVQIKKFKKTPDGKSVLVNSEVTIGKITSTGELGKIKTIGENGKDGERDISDVNAENQNSSLDNIKATIMAKRNENKYTLNVLTQMAFRGFDAVYWENENNDTIKNQVTSLFLSQPILRRYSELMSEKESVFNDKKYIDVLEREVLEQLLKEYDKNAISSKNGKKEYDVLNFISDEIYDFQSEKMTGAALYNDLIDNPSIYRPDMQVAVLAKFFKLKAEAAQMSKYQTLVSVSGLGLSYFNVLDKIETLNRLAKEEQFENMQGIVGEFVPVNSEEYANLVDTGEIRYYTLIGDNWIKPTTTEGTVLINSLKAAQDTMDLVFPYKNDVIQTIISELLGNSLDASGLKRYKLLNTFKDFLQSQQLGLFNGSVKENRESLFFDSKDNASLAMFLARLQDSKHKIFENPLLKSLTFDINQDGTPSFVNHFFNNDLNFEDDNKYQAFNLLVSDKTTELGIINQGTPNEVMVTPQILAQYLASYAYLSDNTAGVTGFKKYINLEYLKIIGVTDKIRATTDINNLSESEGAALAKLFIRQYYQHNLDKVRDYSRKPKSYFTEYAKNNNDTAKLSKAAFFNQLDSFVVIDTEDSPVTDKYIKIATKVPGNNGFYLYEYNGNEYVRIASLGAANFVEYDSQTAYVTSIMNPKQVYATVGNEVFNAKLETLQEDASAKDTIIANFEAFRTNQKRNVNVKTLLDVSDGVSSLFPQILGSNLAKYKEFSEELLKFVDTDTEIIFYKTSDENIPENIKEKKLAVYAYHENIIYINEDFLNSTNLEEDALLESLENVILEEIVHSITIKELLDSGSFFEGVYTLTDKRKGHIKKLVDLYEIAKNVYPYSGTGRDNYYTKNIFEFVAGVFVSEDFRNQLDNISAGDKTILDKFKEALHSMLMALTGAKYSNETIKTIYKLLEVAKENKTNKKDVIKSDSKQVEKLFEKQKKDSEKVIEVLDNDKKSVSETNAEKLDATTAKNKVVNNANNQTQAQEIYDKLGNKTVSGNVEIVEVYQKEGVQYAEDNNAIFSLRVNGSEKHFGNPFSNVPAEIAKGLIATNSTKESVEKYIDWILGNDYSVFSDFKSPISGEELLTLKDVYPERAKWIREMLKSGELKGKDIIYYKELGEPSHATALDYLINSPDSPFNQTQETNEVTIGSGKSVFLSIPKAHLLSVFSQNGLSIETRELAIKNTTITPYYTLSGNIYNKNLSDAELSGKQENEMVIIEVNSKYFTKETSDENNDFVISSEPLTINAIKSIYISSKESISNSIATYNTFQDGIISVNEFEKLFKIISPQKGIQPNIKLSSEKTNKGIGKNKDVHKENLLKLFGNEFNVVYNNKSFDIDFGDTVDGYKKIKEKYNNEIVTEALRLAYKDNTKEAVKLLLDNNLTDALTDMLVVKYRLTDASDILKTQLEGLISKELTSDFISKFSDYLSKKGLVFNFKSPKAQVTNNQTYNEKRNEINKRREEEFIKEGYTFSPNNSQVEDTLFYLEIDDKNNAIISDSENYPEGILLSTWLKSKNIKKFDQNLTGAENPLAWIQFNGINRINEEFDAELKELDNQTNNEVKDNEANNSDNIVETIFSQPKTDSLVNEFDNKTELNNEDYVAYEKTVRDLSEKLAHRIGATVKFENDKTLDYQSKIVDDVVYVNLASATITTPVHSILSVPIVKAIKEENYELYKNLLKTLQEPKGIEILNRLNGENENDFQDNQELAIAELLSLYTTDKLNKYKDRNVIGLFKSLFKSISNFVKGLLKAKQLEIAKLPENMTINDLANLFAYSKSNLILPGYQATYTTPDNKKFKTYEEANNHITNLIKQYESYNENDVDNAINNIEANEIENNDFIDANNDFEKSKQIIEEFKRVNEIVYNPQEVYSRGHEFVSVIGAYTSFDVNLMMQNLLEHISDNKKAGTKFTISAFTRPVNTKVDRLETGSSKIRFKIQPQSEDIEWAANKDCYSGNSIGASKNIDSNIDSEVLGVSYTKSPSMLALKNVQPNLANIIDNISDKHNELGITLTGENFRLEYDQDVSYETKQILNSINAILDQRYGKFKKEVVPELSNERFNLRQELFSLKINKKKADVKKDKETSEKLNDLINKLQIQIDNLESVGIVSVKNNDNITTSIEDIKNSKDNSEVVFTEKATNNLKIAALKQFAKKYPRILITSKVEKIDNKNIDNSNVIEENIPKLPEIRKCN